jgi:hypothetical protein
MRFSDNNRTFLNVNIGNVSAVRPDCNFTQDSNTSLGGFTRYTIRISFQDADEKPNGKAVLSYSSQETRNYDLNNLNNMLEEQDINRFRRPDNRSVDCGSLRDMLRKPKSLS